MEDTKVYISQEVNILFITFFCSDNIGDENPAFGFRTHLHLNNLYSVTDDILTANHVSKRSVSIIKFYSVCNVSGHKKSLDFIRYLLFE